MARWCDTASSMNRREFVRLAAAAGGTTALADTIVAAQVRSAPAGTTTPTGRTRMSVGTQHGDSDDVLRAMAAFGVNHICSRLPSPRLDEAWSVEGLTRLKDRVQSFGISLDMVPLPLSSSEISEIRESRGAAGDPGSRSRDRRHLPDDPERRPRRHLQVKYNLTFLGVLRTGAQAGPRPLAIQHVRYSKRKGIRRHAPRPARWMPTPSGSASPTSSNASSPWRRNTRCASPATRTTPACRKGQGWRGVQTRPGHRRRPEAVRLDQGEPYHGLNFCQGTVSRDAREAGRRDLRRHPLFRRRARRSSTSTSATSRAVPELPGDLPRQRRRGHAPGDAVYQQVGYDGMIMPDHAPRVEGDPNQFQGFAFAIGYITALIAAVNAEV